MKGLSHRHPFAQRELEGVVGKLKTKSFKNVDFVRLKFKI